MSGNLASGKEQNVVQGTLLQFIFQFLFWKVTDDKELSSIQLLYVLYDICSMVTCDRQKVPFAQNFAPEIDLTAR